jgi:hypothetical protein
VKGKSILWTVPSRGMEHVVLPSAVRGAKFYVSVALVLQKQRRVFRQVVG